MSSSYNIENIPIKNGFRQRGYQFTRLEAFSDAAFAFAMTMLVISVGDIPSSYSDLITALKGIPTFAASFISIMAFWSAHRTWSKRFGLEDSISTIFSLFLVFIVLIYLYPLKIAFSSFFYWISNGWLPTNFAIKNDNEMVGIFITYGFGLMALSASIVLLNWRALKLTNTLKLNTLEINSTKMTIMPWALMTVTGFFSALIALLFPTQIGIYAGFVYFSLAITMPLTIILTKKKTIN